MKDERKWYSITIGSTNFVVKADLEEIHKKVMERVEDYPKDELIDFLFYGYISNEMLRWGYWNGVVELHECEEILSGENRLNEITSINDFTADRLKWDLWEYGEDFWYFVSKFLYVDIVVGSFKDKVGKIEKINRQDFFGIDDEE